MRGIEKNAASRGLPPICILFSFCRRYHGLFSAAAFAGTAFIRFSALFRGRVYRGRAHRLICVPLSCHSGFFTPSPPQSGAYAADWL